MSKVHIVIPVINCLDLTRQTIESIRCSETVSITLIDNDSDDGTEEWALNSGRIQHYIKNTPRKGVAASWNQGVKEAMEDSRCEYIAILNNDIILHPKTLDHLIAFMDRSNYLMVTGDNIKDRMSADVMKQMELPEPFTDFDLWPIEGWRAEGPDFSCFMINKEFIRVVGLFDENFKGAYKEDQDTHRRIKAARDHIKEHDDHNIAYSRVHAKRLSTAPYYHYASQTIQLNPKLRHEISLMHGRNGDYYMRKWGADHEGAMDGQGFVTPFGDATKNWRDWDNPYG